MGTQTIEVEGLPEGWRGISINIPTYGQNYWNGHNVCLAATPTPGYAYLIVEKIQPRMIVLEETTEIRKAVFGEWVDNNGVIEQWRSQKESQSTYRIWREVKETDEEPYLKLTKKDMLELIEHIKLGGHLNHKIAEFIKDK